MTAAAAEAGTVNPRHGLLTGAAMAVFAATVLATAPVTWLEDLLAASGHDATTFLVRRYAASATAALAVAAIAVARHTNARRALLLGLSTWFGVQAVAAWWGLATGTVGGFAWVAMIADPFLAVWFLLLARKEHRTARPDTGEARSGRTQPALD
jgi:hypothetical protein